MNEVFVFTGPNKTERQWWGKATEPKMKIVFAFFVRGRLIIHNHANWMKRKKCIGSTANALLHASSFNVAKCATTVSTAIEIVKFVLDANARTHSVKNENYFHCAKWKNRADKKHSGTKTTRYKGCRSPHIPQHETWKGSNGKSIETLVWACEAERTLNFVLTSFIIPKGKSIQFLLSIYSTAIGIVMRRL